MKNTYFCCWQEQENCGIFFEQNIVTFFNETGICLEHEFHNRVPATICNALANRNASKELNPSKQVLGLQICDWPTRCKHLETPYWEMPVFKNTNVDFILGWTFYLRELFWPDLFDVVRLVCLDISFQSMFAHVANFKKSFINFLYFLTVKCRNVFWICSITIDRIPNSNSCWMAQSFGGVLPLPCSKAPEYLDEALPRTVCFWKLTCSGLQQHQGTLTASLGISGQRTARGPVWMVHHDHPRNGSGNDAGLEPPHSEKRTNMTVRISISEVCL